MKYPMDEPVRWNLFLPKELLFRLRKTAYRRSMPTSELVRQACLKYLEALDKREAAHTTPAPTPAPDGR